MLRTLNISAGVERMFAENGLLQRRPRTRVFQIAEAAPSDGYSSAVASLQNLFSEGERWQMRRKIFAGAVVGAALGPAIGKSLTAVAKGPRGHVERRVFAVGAQIDGIVMRGKFRAHVAAGRPSLTILGSETRLGAVRIARDTTTLIISSTGFVELFATLAHVRGLATSGAVLLTLAARSDAPLFLDLAGAGTVDASGSVPLLRVTTSGSVSADLTGLVARQVRVHARQASRLAVRAVETLTIVALDTALVTYRGTPAVHLTKRDAAEITRQRP